MKAFLLSFFLLCFGFIFCLAQKETNIWYFGYRAGLDFNSGAPVALTNGQINTREGVATACDTAGALLFYTDGSIVWNKNNGAMTNGTGLLGNSSATQSATIVPMPGSSTKYYIFTCPSISGSFCYSIVDMTLAGGLGDVSTKNVVLLATTSSEKCAAIQKSATEVWVIAHNQDTVFYSYLITASGIAAPVISKNIFYGGTYPYSVGYLKASPKGDRIAAAMYGTALLDFAVYDFDCSTGIISNEKSINIGSDTYGLEFSPDSKKLYVMPYTSNTLYQYDITLSTASAIAASQINVGTVTTSGGAGDLQIGPDQKIYITTDNAASLDVVNNPDITGVGCNFVSNSLFLGGKSSALAFPARIRGSICSTGMPVASFQSSDTTFCTETGECINFFDQSTGNPTNWQWIFTGATPSTAAVQNPTNICYYNPGTYPVTLIVANNAGTDTLAVAPLIIFGTPPPPPTITVIGGDTLISSVSAHYQWFFNGAPIAGATDSFYIAIQGGLYAVQVTDSLGCTSLSNGELITGFASPSFEEELGVKLYPNPVSGELTISFPFQTDEIIISNVVGEELQRGMIEKSKASVSFSMSGFSNGIYFLQLRSGTSIVNRRFIVLRK